MLITFKKVYGNDIFISDVPYEFRISHNYFCLPEKRIPLESLQFKQLLNTGQISVVRIEGDGVNKKYFERYLKPDKGIAEQEQKREEIRKEEIVIKEEKIKIETEKKEKIETEKKLAREKSLQKEEVLIDEDNVEDMVDDFLAYD